ncbi:unnamed protein product [Coffea canephora]|uniref:Uncharacterized protein n=1 Tax=Coffea canephora TaxID=49390 RepID=A0A068UUY4_COFCA|nr:unnamed protein product [Coffea canephora]
MLNKDHIFMAKLFSDFSFFWPSYWRGHHFLSLGTCQAPVKKRASGFLILILLARTQSERALRNDEKEIGAMKSSKRENSKRIHPEEETGVMKSSKQLAFQGQAMDQEDDQGHDGGSRALNRGYIEINAWKPDEGPLEWTLLGRKHLGSSVYNCIAMGC